MLLVVIVCLKISRHPKKNTSYHHTTDFTTATTTATIPMRLDISSNDNNNNNNNGFTGARSQSVNQTLRSTVLDK